MMPIVADVVWPALYLETRLFSWWAIGAGLVVEFFFVRWLTALDLRMCVAADLAMNAVSALLGVLLIPLAGIVWEFMPGIYLNAILKIGTFNPVTWTATFLLAVFINAGLEVFVLRRGFKQQMSKKVFWGLCIANSLSVGLALGSLFFYPIQP